MEITKEQELFQNIVQKAWEDNSFKQALITNPLQAIKDLTGEELNLPKDKTLVVRDQTDKNVVYINIPAKVELDDVELNEEQLDIVTGGGEGEDPILIDPNDPLYGLIGDDSNE
jgi:hypothetical protein